MTQATTAEGSDVDLILEAKAIEVTIDGTEILRGVDLDVRRGEVHVLIGPNGAGKTTFANAITGHVPVTGGSLFLSGSPLQGSIVRRARRGIGRKFQVPRVFERLTVGENLVLAGDVSDDPTLGASHTIDVGDHDASAASLAHGLRQRLEMRMVLGRDPAIAVLDEPTAGMTKTERNELGEIVRAQAGKQTFLIVEHDMDFVEKVADRVSFMSEGVVRITGSFAEISANPDVQRAYLGTSHGESEARVRTIEDGGSGALSVDGLFVRRGNLDVIRDVSFAVPAGRALGVLGRNGAGKTTLLMGLMGLLESAGQVSLDGESIADHAAWRRAEEGVALVPQGRQLFADLTVRENLQLATFGKTAGGQEFDVHTLFPVLERLADRRAGFLSGGEQQQVAIARALLRRPTLLILDEPTEGLAPAIIEEISSVLRFLSDEGLTIVLAEQHRSVVEYVCDEFVVLRGGEIAGAGPVDSKSIDAFYLTL
jgi:branched-chain amino acid transport system ATP-binding protein